MQCDAVICLTVLTGTGDQELRIGHQAFGIKYRAEGRQTKLFIDDVGSHHQLLATVKAIISDKGKELKNGKSVGLYFALHANANGFGNEVSNHLLPTAVAMFMDEGIKVHKINLNACYSGGRNDPRYKATAPHQLFLGELSKLVKPESLDGTMVAAYTEMVILVDTSVESIGDERGSQYSDQGAWNVQARAQAEQYTINDVNPRGVHNTFAKGGQTGKLIYTATHPHIPDMQPLHNLRDSLNEFAIKQPKTKKGLANIQNKFGDLKKQGGRHL